MKNELSIELTSKFNDLSKALEQTTNQVAGLNKQVNNVFRDLNKNANLNKFDKNLSGLAGKARNVGNILSSSFRTVQNTLSTALGMIEKSIDYSENLNLFNVAMGDLSDKGMKFQKAMNEAFGTNMSETLRYQGLFQSMSKSMGIAENDAYKLSEGLTKIGMDLASLYNISDTSAWAKLRAGLAGQTEPLRTVGMDITENSLKPLIQRLNLTDSKGEFYSVRQLNYAEKMILRYIAIVDQAKVAQGDFANTIEAPSNQLKILGMQSKEAGRALGNLFVGAFARILPYANAIIMVIKEVANAIAGVLGIEISDYNTSIGDLSEAFADVGDSTDAIGDGLDSANKKAKKLKETMTAMSFDELHNISTPTPSSSSKSSGSGIGTIDPRLLAALGAYENGMEKVRMKAAEIRDKIMEWLGFTKKINPLTGETYWSYEGISKTLSNMWKSFQKLSTEGKILVGLGLGIGTLKLWNAGKKLLTVFGGSGLVKTLVSLISPTASLVKGIGALSLAYGSLGNGVRVATQNWRIEQGIIDGTTGKINGLSGALKITTNSLIGIGTSAVGFYTLSKSVQNLTENGTSVINVLGTLGGSLASIAGLTMAGASAFGAYGAIAGATVGVIGGLISAFYGYATAKDEVGKRLEREIELLDKHTKAIKEERKAIEDNMNLQLTQTTYSTQLISELESLVDANGRVKDGYEDRAKFILENLKKAYGVEYELVDGQIKKYGDYIKSIKEAIETKKAEILLQASEEAYANAIKNKTQQQYNYIKAENALKEKENERKERLEKLETAWNNMNDAQKRWQGNDFESWANREIKIKQYNKEIDEAKIKLNEASDAYKTTLSDIENYENLETAIITENKEAQKQAIKEYTNTIKVENGSYNASLTERIQMANYNSEEQLKIWKKSGKDITDEMKNQALLELKELANNLTAQTNEVKKLTPEQKKAWKSLAESNFSVYEENLLKLEPTMRENIQKATGVIVEKTPEVEAKTDELSKKMLKKMKKDKEAKQAGTDIIKEYLTGLSDSQQRKLLEDCGVKNTDKVMAGLKKGNLSSDVGVQIIQGLNNGLKNNYWQGQTLNTAFTFATGVLNKFKKTFGIASPSKVLKDYGVNLDRGLLQGINKEEHTTISGIEKFSNNIVSAFKSPLENINTELSFSDYKPIDITKTLNYGKITSEMNSRTKIDTDGGFIKMMAYALGNAVNDKSVDVNLSVRAKTDKGTIVETAIEGINDIKDRTGECPIKVV